MNRILSSNSQRHSYYRSLRKYTSIRKAKKAYKKMEVGSRRFFTKTSKVRIKRNVIVIRRSNTVIYKLYFEAIRTR